MTFNPVDKNFLSKIEVACGPKVFRPSSQSYTEEPRGRWIGKVGAVVAPRNVSEASKTFQDLNVTWSPEIDEEI